MEYRIYYADDSTHDGPPEVAAAFGVIAIVQPDEEVGRVVLHRDTAYWWQDGMWFGGDWFGAIQYLAKPGWRRVLFGETVPNARYRDIVNRAIKDPDFPPKSGWRSGEARP